MPCERPTRAFGAADQLTAAILAGGAARRLDGLDKGLQPLGGRPLVAWAVDALQAAGVRRIVVVANRNRDLYARHAPVVADRAEGFRGPLAGIATALDVCATPWLLCVPVDCPRPPPDLLTRLWQRAAKTDCAAVVAEAGGRPEPLFALYRRTLASSAAAALAADLGVGRWQQSLPAATVGFEADAFVNLNTHADFRAFEEALHA